MPRKRLGTLYALAQWTGIHRRPLQNRIVQRESAWIQRNKRQCKAFPSYPMSGVNVVKWKLCSALAQKAKMLSNVMLTKTKLG